MGKRQDFIDLYRAGGGRKDFIALANSHGTKDPLEALTIYDMLMSGALPSELKHGGIVSTENQPPIPEAIPLVKQFVSDDPTTYLTDEDQMKGMLIATLEEQPAAVDEEILAESPAVDQEILNWQMEKNSNR
jgi:hypothetical protein